MASEDATGLNLSEFKNLVRAIVGEEFANDAGNLDRIGNIFESMSENGVLTFRQFELRNGFGELSEVSNSTITM